MATSVPCLLCLTLNCHFYCACLCFKKALNDTLTFYLFEYVFYICNNLKNKVFVCFSLKKHNIIIWAFIKCQHVLERQCFCHCVHISFKSYFNNPHLNFLIFATDTRNTCFTSFVSFILNNFIIALQYLSLRNGIFTRTWTGAIVRYHGNWKWWYS